MTSNNNNNQQQQQQQPRTSLFADDDNGVIYTTQDGKEIPPQWETSIMMALDFENDLAEMKKNKERQQNNGNNNDDDDQQQQENETSPKQPTYENHDNPHVDIAKLLAELDQLTSTAANELMEEMKKKKEIDDDQEEENDEEEEELFEGTDAESAMEGMIHSTSAMSMEREETDPSQWKLEEILIRKSVPIPDEDAYESADVEDDDAAEIVGRSATRKKKSKKEFSYLCKWAPGGRCTTWELRSLLVEEGFGPQVDAYDAKIKEKGKTAPQERTADTFFKGPCPYRSKVGESANFVLPDHKKKKPKDIPLEALYDFPKISVAPLASHQLFFEKLFPNIRHTLQQNALVSSRCAIRRMINIAPAEPSHKFMEVLKTNPHWSYGILYHGTSPGAIKAIMQQGLLVPGKDDNGLRVVNGSANGIAIYTATNLSFSANYCKGGNKMFVCVGITETNISYVNQSVHIFRDEAHVVPVWLIEWQQLPHYAPYIDPIGLSRYPPADWRAKILKLQIEYFYNLNEFHSLPPAKNMLDELFKESEKEHLNPPSQLPASSVSSRPPISNKEYKKLSRWRRRVLAISGGVPIEQA